MWTEIIATGARTTTTPGQFEWLMFVGATSVAVMLFAFAHERGHPGMTLVGAAAAIVAAGYGFTQGAWPLGVAQLVWAAMAARRWWLRAPQRVRRQTPRRAATTSAEAEARLARLFGQPGHWN